MRVQGERAPRTHCPERMTYEQPSPEADSFPGRVGIQQRVLPTYRVPFFDRLAPRCAGGLQVFAGEPRAQEGIAVADTLSGAGLVQGRNYQVGQVGFHLCWQRGLLPWLRQWKPDVLVVSANPRLLSTHLAVRLMRAEGRAVVGWGLGSPAFSSGSGVTRAPRQWVIRRFLRSFDALVAYGSVGAAEYVRAGVPPDRVLIAFNAVSNADAEALSAQLSEHPDLVRRYRQDLGLSGKPVVLFVGRLMPQKRVDDLLRACSTLSDMCELLIVGDGPERAALENLAATLLPQTRFLGHLQGQDLALAYAAADLFVLPGTGGLAVHEAMLYGKPVVVGASDGTQADLVREGSNGFILPAGGGVNALERTIRSCLGDSRSLRRMGLESRRIATEEVSIGAMVDAFVRTLLLVAGRRSPSRAQ